MMVMTMRGMDGRWHEIVSLARSTKAMKGGSFRAAERAISGNRNEESFYDWLFVSIAWNQKNDSPKSRTGVKIGHGFRQRD
jgi:hypothetical protein